ncbi:uncharacterized protein METZ01_LOCUS127852, partial [marine metagenome]
MNRMILYNLMTQATLITRANQLLGTLFLSELKP